MRYNKFFRNKSVFKIFLQVNLVRFKLMDALLHHIAL